MYLAVHKMSPSRDEQSNFSDCSAALSASAHSKHGYKILKNGFDPSYILSKFIMKTSLSDSQNERTAVFS